MTHARFLHRLLFDNVEELDLEHEGGAGFDLWGRSAIAIGQVRRTDQLALSTNLDLLHALRPTLDDLVQPESGRFAPLHGTVEHGAIDEGAVVMHLHRVRGFWVCPFPFLACS